MFKKQSLYYFVNNKGFKRQYMEIGPPPPHLHVGEAKLHGIDP